MLRSNQSGPARRAGTWVTWVEATFMTNAVERDSDAVVPPSSLFVFWPGDEPPLAEELRYRLDPWGSPALADTPNAEDTLWSFWLELGDRPLSHLIWCEAVAGPHLRFLDHVHWRGPDQEATARACKWVVGLEGPISLRHPTLDYQLQLRLCEAISREWSPVIYDASSFVFRTPGEVERLTQARTPPRTAALYALHKLKSGTQTFPATALYWLHTHGLERAGVPDLEIFDVPERLVPAACELIETVANLWIETQTPPAETAFAVGCGVEATWRPWQAVVEERRDDAVGGWRHRRDDNGHAGYRAVLLSAKPRSFGSGRAPASRWRSPVDVLESLTKPDTTLYRTVFETRRMAQLARERWGSFGILYAGKHPENWRFAVKLRYDDSGPAHSEHLWFDVTAIQPDRIQGRLVSTPSFLRTLHVGDVGWHELDRLSDWRILTPHGGFDPETADALFESLAVAE